MKSSCGPWRLGVPKILNAKHVGTTSTKTREYVGRPSPWGNPFQRGLDGGRIAVIEKYREWICEQPDLLARLTELKGKDLICWCEWPLDPCHAEILLTLANPIERTPE